MVWTQAILIYGASFVKKKKDFFTIVSKDTIKGKEKDSKNKRFKIK